LGRSCYDSVIMKIIFLALILLGSKAGLAESAGSDTSLRFLFSAGAGSRADGSAYAVHLRGNADWDTEANDYGYGLGLEFARAHLTEGRETKNFFYSFEYLLGLRLTFLIRTSDSYTTRFVLAGGPTRLTYSPSQYSNYNAAKTLGFDVGDATVDHSRQGQYAGLGIHFQREHPTLVRLSEWGLTFTYYRAEFPTGWFREGRNDIAEAPGLMDVFLLNLHVGVGGMIDL
jgi:hypothetical protein